jgi:hypothetical protein
VPHLRCLFLNLNSLPGLTAGPTHCRPYGPGEASFASTGLCPVPQKPKGCRSIESRSLNFFTSSKAGGWTRVKNERRRSYQVVCRPSAVELVCVTNQALTRGYSLPGPRPSANLFTASEPRESERSTESAAATASQYSRLLVMPGIGTGYLPSGPHCNGASEFSVSWSSPGANSWSPLRI